MLIADVNEGIVPLKAVIDTAIKDKDTIREKELIAAEKSLLYVAATRAKKELAIMSWGRQSALIKQHQSPIPTTRPVETAGSAAVYFPLEDSDRLEIAELLRGYDQD